MERYSNPDEDAEREIDMLETDLRRLEAEYNMYFGGQLARPPIETRQRVEGTVRRLDRKPVQSYALRFRFNTLQARYATFVDLWDRGVRAREEGRPGPFARGQKKAPGGEYRVVHVTTLVDARHDIDKIQELYDRVMEVRQEAGDQERVPFHKFVQLVNEQLARLKKAGSPEVAFRLAVKSGKVNLTARALKGLRREEP